MNLVGKLHIDGIFEGRIASVDSVTIGRRGEVSGVIRAHQVCVSGQVDGEVYCDELTIERGGHVRGAVHSRQMTIHKRGNFIGERDLTSDSSKLPNASLNRSESVLNSLPTLGDFQPAPVNPQAGELPLDSAATQELDSSAADRMQQADSEGISEDQVRKPEQLTRMLDEMLGELPKVGNRLDTDSPER